MIVLGTLNARYAHASFGLRYLLANMGELRPRTSLLELEITTPRQDALEQILERNPRIVGFGVYIWNVVETTALVADLKRVRPDVTVVLGGPEVSYETAEQEICRLADYVICGEADLAFAALARALVAGEKPAGKIIEAPLPDLAQVALPYDDYTEEDLAHRVIYVEASRGCPYRCEFCLSSLDVPVRAFATDRFLAAMERLIERGARNFKFVDRTFNLSPRTSATILGFFLTRMTCHRGAPSGRPESGPLPGRDDPAFGGVARPGPLPGRDDPAFGGVARPGPIHVHFELVPDRFPAELRELAARSPEGSIQFEIGIQTFNEAANRSVSRFQDDRKACENLRFLRDETKVHVHADLLFGLPGESVASFGASFDRLLPLVPGDIQIGVLKRLRGTPIVRHEREGRLTFSPVPPYEVLATDAASVTDTLRMKRFARYFEVFRNSGAHARALALVFGSSPFAHFLAFADWLHAKTGRTNQLALTRRCELLFEFLVRERLLEPRDVATAIVEDFYGDDIRSERLPFLEPHVDVAALMERQRKNRVRSHANRRA